MGKTPDAFDRCQMHSCKKTKTFKMEVIMFEKESFYKLIREIVERIKAEHNITEDRWIPASEVMKLLNIKSPTTLQKLRDSGAIRFSQPEKKIILYDRQSILKYLERNAKQTF